MARYCKDGISKSYLFGAIQYQSVGDISRVDLFGLNIYARVGSLFAVCGLVINRAGK